MIWACIVYSDGLRVRHIFRNVHVYVVGDRLHVAGETLCMCTFSHDTSGARVDVMDPLLALVGEDVPSNACQQCERTTRHGN